MALPKYQKAKAATAAESSKKRAAAPEKPEPVKKRGKIAERKAAASAAAEKRAAIASAIEESSSLPAAVREALCSSLQGSCSSVGPFHPFQEKILRMVNQTLNDIETESLSKRRKAADGLTAGKQDLARLAKEQTDAEAALESAKTLVQSKERLLSEGLLELRSCEEGLPTAEEELGRRDAMIGEKVMEIELAQDALSKMGEENPSEEVVRALLQELSLPVDSLHDMAEVQSQLNERVTMLQGVVSQAGKSRKELVAKLKACQVGIHGAREKQQANEEALKEARPESEQCAASLKEMVGNFAQQKKITNQASKTYRAAQESVSQLQEGPLAAFKEIAQDIEQRHEVKFLVVNKPTQEETVQPLEPHMETSDQAEAATTDKGKLEKIGGTPVIDRSKRDAVLRRRSAALPFHLFSRKSVMSRRASISRASLSQENQETKSFKSCGSDSDAGDAVMETEPEKVVIDAGDAVMETEPEKVVKLEKDTCDTIEGLTAVPTPHRNSIGSAA